MYRERAAAARSDAVPPPARPGPGARRLRRPWRCGLLSSSRSFVRVRRDAGREQRGDVVAGVQLPRATEVGVALGHLSGFQPDAGTEVPELPVAVLAGDRGAQPLVGEVVLALQLGEQ